MVGLFVDWFWFGWFSSLLWLLGWVGRLVWGCGGTEVWLVVFGWLVGPFVGWLVRWLVFDRLVDWRVGSLVGFGWLVGRFVFG